MLIIETIHLLLDGFTKVSGPSECVERSGFPYVYLSRRFTQETCMLNCLKDKHCRGIEYRVTGPTVLCFKCKNPERRITSAHRISVYIRGITFYSKTQLLKTINTSGY